MKKLAFIVALASFLIVCGRQVEVKVSQPNAGAETPVTTSTCTTGVICPDVCPAPPVLSCPAVVCPACPEFVLPSVSFQQTDLTYNGKPIHCMTSNLGGIDCDFMEYHFRTGDVNAEFLAWADAVTQTTTP